ncbi:hypothetical protein SAMN05660284_02660 [Formivibrio citricus]|uniref:Uncharacterized protein n=1 Tax=Formivibrio citricus TaxID=83765 RepID=A0A1I5DHD8_9NEIS|nr:hypothetical protein [Formivibrio citricus]SFN98649.1 hypothetical protein SAMN05660284_02660 [Formivibrio citricus]
MRKLLFLFMALLASQAMARLIPANARLGEVSSVAPMQVIIGKDTLRPAPGLRVFSQQNTLIFLHQLPVGSLVNYQLDIRGELFQVWILTPEELKQKGLSSPASTSSY